MIALPLRPGCTHSLALLALLAFPAAPLLLQGTQTPGQAGSTPAAKPVAPGLPQPGELPANAGEQARSLWSQLVAATAGEAQGRIRSFDLTFEGRAYSGEKQSNDFDARYLYLEPGFVRMVLASGRERMRGPTGDFLVDKSGVYSLRGRDFAEDVRELDETVAVSRLFVGLSDPRKLRLTSLAVLPAPPASLPEAQAKRAKELQWIVVESPDFRGRADKAAVTVDRVELGLDRESHLAALAIVTDPRDPRSAVLARLEDYRLLDGYRVPWKVSTWRVAEGQVASGPAAGPQPTSLAFDTKPAVRLWLLEGTLKPPLQPANFDPPAAKAAAKGG